MKRVLAMVSSTVICTFFVAVSFAVAQDAANRANTQNDATAAAARGQAGALDDKTTGANVRVSQLIGMNIQNPQRESVGEINDLVLDATRGRVRYAAVTYGGFLGMGNKMFAVPFEAFRIQMNPDDADEFILVLDVTQQQLDGATGFDEDHWPNFADESFTNELDKRYGVTRRDRRRGANVDVRVNRNGVDVDVNRDK